MKDGITFWVRAIKNKWSVLKSHVIMPVMAFCAHPGDKHFPGISSYPNEVSLFLLLPFYVAKVGKAGCIPGVS